MATCDVRKYTTTTTATTTSTQLNACCAAQTVSVMTACMARLLKLLSRHEDDDHDWHRQNVGKSKLYDYIHLQDNGKLVDVFNTRNTPEQRSRDLDDIIRREIAQFLYNNGHGQRVTSQRNAFAPRTSVSSKCLPLGPYKISDLYSLQFYS